MSKLAVKLDSNVYILPMGLTQYKAEVILVNINQTLGCGSGVGRSFNPGVDGSILPAVSLDNKTEPQVVHGDQVSTLHWSCCRQCVNQDQL